MPLTLPLTDKQPERWPRHRIDECFTVLPGATTAKKPIDAMAGDIHMVVGRGDEMHARVLTQDETVELDARSAILRSKGKMRPELMALMLNQPSVQRSLVQMDHRANSSFLGFRPSNMREMIIAVPDPQAQAMMLEAHTKSVELLAQQSGNFHKLADTMGKMAQAIAMEILQGKQTTKDALLLVSQAMGPWFRLVDKPTSLRTYSSEDVAQQTQTDQRFVSLADHQEQVAMLRSQIRELQSPKKAEAAAPAEETPATAPRRPGP